MCRGVYRYLFIASKIEENTINKEVEYFTKRIEFLENDKKNLSAGVYSKLSQSARAILGNLLKNE